MNTDRRTTIGALLAAAGAGSLAVSAFARGPGEMSEGEFKRLSMAPKTPADHRALAKHYRAMALEHEAEAKAFEALGAAYDKGLPGVGEGSAHELARAARHAAEHSRDFAEAATDLAEVHEGIVAGPI